MASSEVIIHDVVHRGAQGAPRVRAGRAAGPTLTRLSRTLWTTPLSAASSATPRSGTRTSCSVSRSSSSPTCSSGRCGGAGGGRAPLAGGDRPRRRSAGRTARAARRPARAALRVPRARIVPTEAARVVDRERRSSTRSRSRPRAGHPPVERPTAPDPRLDGCALHAERSAGSAGPPLDGPTHEDARLGARMRRAPGPAPCHVPETVSRHPAGPTALPGEAS